MSKTVSETWLIVENSWWTPLILKDVTAAPSMEERRTRLRALPIVTP